MEKPSTIIDLAVRWLIIVFIFRFDPLSYLISCGNYSFANRHNKDNRQEEMFDGLFHKNEEKTLDNQEEKAIIKRLTNQIMKKRMKLKTFQEEEIQQELDADKEFDEIVKDEIEEEQEQQENLEETKP